MPEKVGVFYELDEDEKIIQESPVICSIEFDKQSDFFESIIGEKIGGRAVCKPYLTNKRILLWLILVPEKGNPASIWYSFPYENIGYMRPGKHGKIEKKKRGLEIEFAVPKVGGVASGIGKRIGMNKSGIRGWIGKKIGEQRTKLWLYVPDFQVWNITLTKILQEKAII
ncbi:hypothetical protein J7L60_05740 [Candidatus Bathyarchaeota archaeon]|nr:hypothetical protein [Candidatus Bathyarchaeota archaeon]